MKSILYICALCLLVSCGTSQLQQTDTDTIIGDSSANETSSQIGSDSPVGTWEIKTETPRGEQTEILTITEENGALMGSTSERTSFAITQNGNELNWDSTLETPMGNMEAKSLVTIDANTLNGTMEITSGPAAGRSLKLSGVRK